VITRTPRRGRRYGASAAVAAAALLALTVSATGPAAAEDRLENGVLVMTPELHDRIQHQVESFIATNDIPGISVAVVTPSPDGPDPVITTFAAGVSDKETKTPVDASTQFELGSETKAFTADLLAYLVATGTVSLDDPVQKWVPEGVVVPEWVDPDTQVATPITLGDLATHQAGLTDLPSNFWEPCPDEDCNPRPDYTQKKLWDAFSVDCVDGQLCPITQPGTDWLYSNWGFGLLGTVLANILHPVPETERPLLELAFDETFLDALGMSSTMIEFPDNPRLAIPYTAEGGKADHWNNWNALAGGGGLISDATDMGTWVAAHLGYVSSDAPLGVRTMADTLTPVAPITSRCSAPGDCKAVDFQMGLAWQLYAADEGVAAPYAFKDGGTAGSSTDTALAPTLRMGVTTLYDKQRPADDQGLQLAVTLLSSLVADAERPAPVPDRPALANTGSTASDLLVPGLGAVALLVVGGMLSGVLRGRRQLRGRGPATPGS
jgi:CubicO group peptidase (beta-lactamase class C family)